MKTWWQSIRRWFAYHWDENPQWFARAVTILMMGAGLVVPVVSQWSALATVLYTSWVVWWAAGIWQSADRIERAKMPVQPVHVDVHSMPGESPEDLHQRVIEQFEARGKGKNGYQA